MRAALKPELCADELVVGSGVGWSYDRRRRRRAAHFSSAASASAASDRMREHSLDRRFFSGFTGVSHFTCDLRWAASVEKLTVNMHAIHNFTV